MVMTFRCVKCHRRLFDVFGGEPTTALSIKCSRCGAVNVFDYQVRQDNEEREDDKKHNTDNKKQTN